MTLAKLEAEARRNPHKSAKAMFGDNELRVGYDPHTLSCWYMINRERVARERVMARIQDTGEAK